MAKLNISKSITIDAPVVKVFQTVSDFHNWRVWSPWLITEPEAKVTVASDGKSYSWEGDRTGSGNIKVTNEAKNESVDYDLNFLKPWKSEASVRFETKSTGQGTEVTWLMNSSLPFFLFWMKKSMTAFIGMDYERGLSMLKDYVETGEVPSKLNFKGTSNFEGCEYIGIKTDCSLDNIGPKMEADFNKLWAYMGENKDLVAGDPFSIYHKWDMVNRKASYTSGVPVKQVPVDLPAGMITGRIPSTKVYTLEHTGKYGHLGNAWSTLYMMERSKSFKKNKGIHPFEVYRNDPSQVSEKELVTDILFAVK